MCQPGYGKVIPPRGEETSSKVKPKIAISGVRKNRRVAPPPSLIHFYKRYNRKPFRIKKFRKRIVDLELIHKCRCGKSFLTKSGLVSHIRKAHIHKCSCGKSF